MEKELLGSFREAYRNLELLPLRTPEALAEFGVEYGQEVIEELYQLVEDDPNRTGKIIFTGHRGCGKSTVLTKFTQRYQEQYFIVLFSISDTIEMSDVNHINILFAIALNLMQQAKLNGLNIPDEDRQNIYRWFAKQTQTEIENVGAEVNLGFDLFKIFSGKLKADAVVRNEIKQEFERKVTDLIARVDQIAALIRGQTEKEILVIIDDLDKLDLSVVNRVFRDNLKPLCQPSFQVIYTIPTAALRDKYLKPIIETGTDDQIVMMRVVKLFTKGKGRVPEEQPVQSAADTLCKVIKKRIPGELLADETASKMVIYSGGVLRELIRVTKECCRICLRKLRQEPELTQLKINHEILEEAVNNLRNDFALPLGKADYEILAETYKNNAPDDPKKAEFLELLHGLHVLEYRNREIWYDVHPIVVGLLHDRELLDGT
ncbi:P-loop NTPase fold protein [Candidatus Cyanaurora vandensis]|uniref:P-loop NTPase fold protein n=1 Tax=Candidatus Cyanaurora vandensis TaxID=2714958 RepID=UPI00257CAC04|nr:P-loop NTPase fold protein [Candidatus Cyanaurora vandensis]